MADGYFPLSLAPIIVNGKDVNPVTKPSIDIYGTSFTLGPFNQLELDIFNAQFPTLLGAPGSEERRIQLERVDVYMLGLRALKHELDNPAFRGLNPGDTELGFGKIRPQFCKGTAYLTNWQKALVAAAWTDFLYASADTGFKMGEDFGFVVTHLQSYVTPTPYLSEVHFKVGRVDLIPSDVRPIKIGDNENGIAHYPIPTMFVVPKETFWMEMMADVSGTEECALGGIVVGLGRVLKETSPSWS